MACVDTYIGLSDDWSVDTSKRPRDMIEANVFVSASRSLLSQVHQLLNNWNEPQKANFIRHVTREYEV